MRDMLQALLENEPVIYEILQKNKNSARIRALHDNTVSNIRQEMFKLFKRQTVLLSKPSHTSN